MKKIGIFKYLIAVGCFLLMGGGVFMFGKWVKKKWIVHVTLTSPHWEQRLSEMNEIKRGKYKIIFLGNSLTELFDLEYYFKDSSLLNCGIVGDFSEGLVKRAGSIGRLKPDKLFIEIGINDIIEQIPLNEICANYEELIEIIKKESPDTKIFIQSNFPVIINRPSILTSDKNVNDLVKEQNENLKDLAKRTHCTFIDIYPAFTERNVDFKALFIWDGIHFTDKAYTIWASIVKPYLSAESAK